MKILNEDYVQLEEFRNLDKKIKEISDMFLSWYIEMERYNPSYWSQLGIKNYSFKKATEECKEDIKNYFIKEFDKNTKKYRG